MMIREGDLRSDICLEWHRLPHRRDGHHGPHGLAVMSGARGRYSASLVANGRIGNPICLGGEF